MRTRESKTETGKTDGKSEGGRFLEDQSKAEEKCRIQSRVSLASEGQERGMSTGGEEEVMVEEEEQQAVVAASSGEFCAGIDFGSGGEEADDM